MGVRAEADSGGCGGDSDTPARRHDGSLFFAGVRRRQNSARVWGLLSSSLGSSLQGGGAFITRNEPVAVTGVFHSAAHAHTQSERTAPRQLQAKRLHNRSEKRMYPGSAGTLPTGYQQQVDPSTGKAFYVNLMTGETSWSPPTGAAAAPAPMAPSAPPSSAGLPPGWEERVDPTSGRPFYINHANKSTSWAKLTRASRGLRTVRTGYAHQPPACCTYRRLRAACPGGGHHCTYAVHVPASAVPHVPCPCGTTGPGSCPLRVEEEARRRRNPPPPQP